MPPLNSEEYAPGRTVRVEGHEVLISDTLTTGVGQRFLIAAPSDSPFSVLLSESAVRDNDDDKYEAVDPEDVGKTPAESPAPDAPDATQNPDTPTSADAGTPRTSADGDAVSPAPQS